ncbi:MAG TPA: diaminopimelate epimerase, partial [Acidimicrobiales bacterium]|nr:diaminopimelate epimerase [Acidimicrobiales bacterium]
MTVSLLKYQAYGNDFLVVLDPAGLPGTDELDSGFVVAICDRHRGIGADGVMVVRPATSSNGGRPPDATMELRNADGGRAETSGNGLACLGLALVDAGLVAGPEVLVTTDAGPRLVTVLERTAHGGAAVRTEMGDLKVGEARTAPRLGRGFEARRVDAGNPHLVMTGSSLEGVDIASLGRSLEQAEPGGQNVEVVAPDGRGGLDLLVWERGVGLTQACGTGSCAAAAAARAAGLVSSRVEVHNPGGTLVVELHGEDPLAPSVFLSGRASRVFRVEL